MALKSYNPIGFEPGKDGKIRGHSFRDKRDRDIITHPVSIQKTKDFFKNTDVDFDFYFVNKPGVGKYAERGKKPWEFIRDTLGISGDQLNDGQINGDRITIFFVGNSAAEKEIMTPWTTAHRIGHAIRNEYAWQELKKWLDGQFKEIFSYYDIKPLPYGEYSPTYEKARSYLANSIGTMRSARNNLIKRPDEFIYELFAQYLNTGGIKLKPLTQNLMVGRGGWGRPETRRTNSLEDVNDTLESIERDFPFYANDVLGNLIGNIYVM